MKGETFMPLLSMIIVQLGYAIMHILTKLAMDSGMNPFVHVAYGEIFGSATLVPFAYFMERKTRPKMTGKIFLLIFISSVLCIPLGQITYAIGLKYSTPTTATALYSITPAITFVMAIFFRLERFRVTSKVGRAKLFGTVICVGGALLLTLYHGPLLDIGPSLIRWRYGERIGPNYSSNNNVNKLLGPVMVIMSAIATALWFIVQTKVNRMYTAPYSCQALMSVMGSIQCSVVALCFVHDASEWSLAHTIRLVSVLQSGIICSALGLCLISWCMNKKGPVYVAVFEPLPLIFVAILSWGFLEEEKWYLGKVSGSILIVLGLCGVIWSAKREVTMSKQHIRNETIISHLESTEATAVIRK